MAIIPLSLAGTVKRLSFAERLPSSVPRDKLFKAMPVAVKVTYW